jgi:twitching motility protein PilT
MPITLKDLCTELARRRGSDLILKEGRPPLMRVTGQLLPSEHPPLDAQSLWNLVGEQMDEAYVRRLEQDREVDFGFEYQDIARFRANVFYQRKRVSCVIRAIPLEVPTIEALNLPSVLKDLANAPNGVVLVTGPTGSGKSTTLSAIVEHINRTRPAHIITI